MQENKLSRRAQVGVVLAAVLGAVMSIGAAYGLLSSAEPRYRAETQVALLPARNTPPADLSNYWEALSRGQAARIGAEVLGQRRWLAPAAQAAGVPVTSIKLAAGAVADTTLIDVSLEAPSAIAAETALNTAVREARPVVEDVSGPFALEVVQSADGSAEKLGVAGKQLLAAVGAAGLLIGGGIALMLARRRPARPESGSQMAASNGVAPGRPEQVASASNGVAFDKPQPAALPQLAALPKQASTPQPANTSQQPVMRPAAPRGMNVRGGDGGRGPVNGQAVNGGHETPRGRPLPETPPRPPSR